jgi:hypothetical protein
MSADVTAEQLAVEMNRLSEAALRVTAERNELLAVCQAWLHASRAGRTSPDESRRLRELTEDTIAKFRRGGE